MMGPQVVRVFAIKKLFMELEGYGMFCEVLLLYLELSHRRFPPQRGHEHCSLFWRSLIQGIYLCRFNLIFSCIFFSAFNFSEYCSCSAIFVG
jgi:hypothetical protein